MVSYHVGQAKRKLFLQRESSTHSVRLSDTLDISPSESQRLRFRRDWHPFLDGNERPGLLA